MNLDLLALHPWDAVDVDPLSLPQPSRGKEVKTLLSDHHFSDTPSTDAPLLCNCVLFQSNHASALQQCVGKTRSVDARDPCYDPARHFATIQPDNLQRVFVRVLLSVCFMVVGVGGVSAG